jgi:hypothetical protein
LAKVEELARNKKIRCPSVSWTIENLDRRSSTGMVTTQAITPNVAPIIHTLPTEEQPPGNGKRVHYQQGAQENEGIGADCLESFFGRINTEH